MTEFFLGTHQPGWLGWIEVPLFVCDRRLRDRVRPPLAVGPWALDSGGFTELQQHGRWTVSPQEYADRVRRYQRWCGRLRWAAPQDWMCEPAVINGGTAGPLRFAGTGLSVVEHQQRTVANYLELRALDPALPFIPVVQGQTPDDYVRHVADYRSAGVDLTTAPLVGVGSVCRRQSMDEAGDILTALHEAGVTRLHGFGFKKTGLRRFARLLTSADSLAWSYDARRSPRLADCMGDRHKNCANCPRYALAWRRDVLAQIAAGHTVPKKPAQLPLWEAA